jgi:hypothetical protein
MLNEPPSGETATPAHAGDPSGVPAGVREDGPAPAWGLWVGVLLVFAAVFVAASLLLYRGRLLYDNDSYYHLAVAREIAAHGLPHDLPWARFSVMRHGFGDKEVLFHFLLAPFAALSPAGDPLLGGRLALAFCDALLAAALAYLGLRAVGPWGAALPFALFYSSPELAWRLIRLRPELLSLLLLLLVLWAAARERYRLLAALAALYALSYTAFHALLGLCCLLFLFFGLVRRRWDWRLPLYAALGVGLGLVVHPHFPKNLEVWVVQSIEFFRLRGELDAGTEFRANASDVVLQVNLAWLLGMAALAAAAPPATAPASRRSHRAEVQIETAARAADAFGVAAGTFGVLYLLMSRFSVYFFPFATLWALFELSRRRTGQLPERPGSQLSRPRWRGWSSSSGRRLPLGAAFGLALLAGLPVAARELATYERRTDPGPGAVRTADRAALALALPAGSRVAAPWRSTALYVFYAPRARYLDLLDPVFMAVPHPEAYAAQEKLFAGDEPDAPLAAVAQLDSELIAFPSTPETTRLAARLEGDPRVLAAHRGFNSVFRILPSAQRAFVLDWRVALVAASAPRAGTGAVNLIALIAATPLSGIPYVPYPRLPPPARSGANAAAAPGGGLAALADLSHLEGYVDGRRMGAGARGGCLQFVHDEEADSPIHVTYELAPSGPSSLALDGRSMVSTAANLGAVLGQGLLVPVNLAPGRHTLTVLTCPDGGAPPRVGFYLLRRERGN